jgi:hypothetical protein
MSLAGSVAETRNAGKVIVRAEFQIVDGFEELPAGQLRQ